MEKKYKITGDGYCYNVEVEEAGASLPLDENYANTVLENMGFSKEQIKDIKWSVLLEALGKEQAYLRSIKLNQYRWLGEALNNKSGETDWAKIKRCAEEILYIAKMFKK